MEADSKQESSLDTIVAILIAVVVAIGALIAWRASLIDDSSGDYDYAGLQANVNAMQARALNYVNTYESYGNYVNYWRNSKLGQLIGQELESASEDQVQGLTEQMKVADDLADANSTMFQVRYLNRDGTYSTQRQLGEMWADAMKKSNIDYTTQYDQADQDRARSRRMLLALMIVSIAPVFYSITESVEGGKKYLMIALGSIAAVAGTVLAVLVELGKI